MSALPGKLEFSDDCVKQMNTLAIVDQQKLGRSIASYVSGRKRPGVHHIHVGLTFVRIEEVRVSEELWALVRKIAPDCYVMERLVQGGHDLVTQVGIDVAMRHSTVQRMANQAGPAARRVTSLAAWLSGPHRAHLQHEWAAHLAGSPEEGVVLSSRQKLLLAMGFLCAALRMRSSDAVRPAWRPVDWTLRSASRTNATITAVVGAQAVYIVGDGGLSALVTDVWEPCGIAGAGLYVLTRWLRRLRGIELAESVREPGDGK
ncbi:hypothetical protein [Streptomyces sp. NRRL F-5702]|uniref:hypothetical protein n=1 Tax=Streptomyces sp. NRRL F-5702 TaxID=1463870 RepID=UPI00131B0330|nr:hypothetical protein [Streptomyces sp. NRRL F-5702]